MTDKFLTADDVKQLTGACTRKKQIESLAANRLVFFVNARGWPVVPLNAISSTPRLEKPVASWQPNLNHIPHGSKKNKTL
jgi:Domain of unknown function (DUF4224)